ncbi:L-serine ammonia-lyase [Candidatus Cyanaurora vandensis]|uniref:L-serine ammonia-lyase n=1 Tax=Candidatus Cyanaurora vandensis TaxID=2714958 RepID=UPI002579E8D5|nr:L-serine ammonia-lyase [Candidatus Cyanaurora vandensis]
MDAITTSIFDLFKVGPGPSSSHTIGPMRAARDFLGRIQGLSGTRLTVELYGSLSATGKGHGTDRAIVAGLLSWTPETCDPDVFLMLLEHETVYPVRLGEQTLIISAEDVHFVRGHHEFPFSNTLIFKLWDGPQIQHQEQYYSVGGGFIQREGEVPSPPPLPPFPYHSMTGLRQQLAQADCTPAELILTNETALTGRSRVDILQKIDDIYGFMHRAVERGLTREGILPGFIQLQRKAPALYRQAQTRAGTPDSLFIFLNAYSIAASEENASGQVVVTAPTSGASGVIPGLSYWLKHHVQATPDQLRVGLLAAAAVGFLVKHNASISGAEMGCMGEVGTASAMGAALLSASAGYGIEVIEAAAEIALEHHLGMTCDPIGGYVQIPCIERNAMGAIKAYNAYLLACSGNHTHQKISLDRVIRVMRATGEDMSHKYKETSEGGLALSSTEC